MKWGNCWIYAVPKWLKKPKQTYLIIRLTRRTWFPLPHVFYAEDIKDLEVEEFRPSKRTLRFLNTRIGRLLAPLVAVFFHGEIRKGKGESNNGSN